MSGLSAAMADIALVATGAYLPERVVTNDELAQTLDTTDAWIRDRTGIGQRHVAAAEQATSDLGAHAARHALDDAGIAPTEVDLVICATSSPDHTQPATASTIHGLLGMRTSAGSIDVNAVCTGWVMALQLAAAQLAAMPAWDHVLVVGAECYSRVVDHADRRIAILFGDGAGAAVVSRVGARPQTGALRLRSFRAGTEPGGAAALVVPAGGTRQPLHTADDFVDAHSYLRMNGPAVRAYAETQLPSAVTEACADAGITPADLALLVPHQSNMRIIEAAVERLGMPMDRVATTLLDTANTAAASIPIALDAARHACRIAPGDAICLAGYGGGLTWASAVLVADT